MRFFSTVRERRAIQSICQSEAIVCSFEATRWLPSHKFKSKMHQCFLVFSGINLAKGKRYTPFSLFLSLHEINKGGFPYKELTQHEKNNVRRAALPAQSVTGTPGIYGCNKGSLEGGGAQ